MPDASYVISSFLGGEISQYAQGRFDRPDYHISLNACLNSFPVEIGAWTRRPGSAHAGFTRGGANGRVVKFDYNAEAPDTIELTDGYLRFRSGVSIITTNDAQAVSSVSTANPAVIQTAAAHGWATGNTVLLPGASTPLLENRQFTITVTDATHFSIADAISGVAIDGSTLGAIGTATVARIQEVQTSYVGSAWQTLRAVQAETTSILLTATVAPQALVATLGNADPVFSLGPIVFNDGPYLDPFTNGIRVTPGSLSGIVTLTLSFATYNSATAYPSGAFVTSSGSNYQSLKDQNFSNTPASSPSWWKAVSLGSAINNGQGILGSDIGRSVRLFNEPSPWASGTTYAKGNFVSYNPSGIPGAETYWQALVGSNTGNVPGTDVVNWSLLTADGAALWTWGRITGIGTSISGSTGTTVGTMTGGGGLAGAFNGVLTQNANAGAEISTSGGNTANLTTLTLSGYVGKNFVAVPGEEIDHVTVYPSSDFGLGAGTFTENTQHQGKIKVAFVPTFVLNLRGSNSAPSSPSNGTLLGTTGSIANTTAAITIPSNSGATVYNYVWVEEVATFQISTDDGGNALNYTFSSSIGQLTMFSPAGTGTGESFNIELLGPSLLYENLITNWQMGLYSATTGWPTCGCYAEGRLWLGGCIANRWDASYANGVSDNAVNMAPTDQYGAVSDANAISYVFNADDVNQIQWMVPDLQGVLMGTISAEWLVQAPTAGPITPTNVVGRRVTKIGSTTTEPKRAEHTLIFVKRYGRKIMEYFPDVFSGKFSAPNLADRAQHITRNGVAELAYTDAVNPIMWGRDELGSLFGATYKRDSLMSSQGPSYIAFHRHQLGTGRTVQSLCSGPSVGGALDALTMVTQDSSGINHVEVLTDAPDELSALQTAWFLDDAVNPTSVSIGISNTTINGLWHLNGLTVQVLAGGLDLGDNGDEGTTPTDFVVNNGSITIPYGDGLTAGPGAGLFTQTFASALSLSQIVVGCTYNSDGQLVRPVTPQETGARTGPAFSKISRSHRFGAQLVNTLGISFGATFDDMYPAKFTMADEMTPIASLTMYSGFYHDALNDDYSRHHRKLCWRVSRPYPATVTAIGPSLETQDQ